MDTYVSHRNNTVTQFIVTRSIMDLFLEEYQRQGPRIYKLWWEQDGFGVKGMWKADR